MMSLISSAVASVASFVASLGSSACFIFMIDEPKCPKSLIK